MTAPTIAWSVDGRAFRCSGPIEAGLPLGGYVRVRPPRGPDRIGQLLEQQVTSTSKGRQTDAGGVMVDVVDVSAPFDDAEVVPASDAEVQRALSGAKHPLEVGTLRGRPAVAARLAARGFNRHTFLCGQSGSGKTYALGVLLERLLLHTRLPLLVLDPNGDHVHLGRPASTTDPGTAAAYRAATAGLTVLRASPQQEEQPLRIRLSDLGATGRGAVMELHPVADRAEYNALLHLESVLPSTRWDSVDEVIAAMRAQGGETVHDLLLRLENLGIAEMTMWGLGRHRPLAAWWDDQPRALVADTSGFGSRRERLAVAVAALTHVWEQRTQRRPFLLVVDEAHDVCPAEPSDQLQAHAVEVFTQLAGEGRKYGIHLLLASQRPDKLPANVLSQCDNLVLMRVNSAADRRALAGQFGFAPAGLVEQAGSFELGEALLAGNIARPPVLARIGRRLTPEGGGDVPTDWATEPAAPA